MIYSLNLKTKDCKKEQIPEDIKFHPIGVPKDARYIDEVVLGSNALQSIGLTAQVWSGHSTRGIVSYTIVKTDV